MNMPARKNQPYFADKWLINNKIKHEIQIGITRPVRIDPRGR